MTFNYETWDGFSDLPKEILDTLLDTTSINKRLADKKNSPYRWRVGSFQVPIGVSRDHLERLCKQKIDRWLSAFDKQGWELASKVQVYPGKDFAYDIDAQVPLLDKREVLCRAIFKTDPKPMRIEVPSTAVRQDPYQTATPLQRAKAEGIKPQKRKR